jgi:hypothetical protein
MKRIFYFLTILMVCAACQDDDSFSTDSGMRLEFSVDTLKLDTVFSRIPSSTYTFWVHNRNNDGIRLQSVRLKRGNQTGYRVNVDGIYLDNSNGSKTNDVEVRRNDSILVFVELTAAETKQQDPVLLEDDLLFTLESGVEQKVCLRAWSWDAQKYYSPVVTKDSVIDSRVPIIIWGDLKVNEGVTLTIKNTDLYFHDNSGIEVYGRLLTENCTMRGDRLDKMFDYLPYDRVSGQWKGIRFYASSTANELRNTVIRNPQYGVICDSAAIDSMAYRLKMSSCVVHNCAGSGVEASNANILLEDCQLTNTLGSCLSVFGGIVRIEYCTLAQFYPFSADRGAALYLTNRKTPLLSLICEGSILTGYEEDVVIGDRSDQAFEYFFSNCLLRTPKSGIDTLRCQQIIWETPQDSIQGKKHFVKIDEENLDYDFHLDSLSTAKGLGCYR